MWHVLVPDFLKRWAIQFVDKGRAEMAFQKGWAKEFAGSRDRVLEYNRKYRHLDEITTLCGITDDSTVLDVGCGISTILHYVKGRRYGIDPLAELYKEIYAYPPDIAVSEGIGERLGFDDGFFDVVFCTNVIDHVEQPERTMAEIRRVLKDTGYFVLTVDLFEAKTKRDPAHPHSLTHEDITGLLGGNFEVVKEYVSPWIGLRNYVNGELRHDHEELILVTRKRS
jgi:ubiquinone/menaquinone biosynthesis C-methylase UbiE